MGKRLIGRSNEDEATLRDVILDLQEWVKYIWPKKWILLVSGALGGGIGLCYALVKPAIDTATTTFVVESNDSNGSLGRIVGMAAIAGIDLGGDAGGLFQGDNILELYKSRKMLAQTLTTKTDPDSDELLIERYMDFTDVRKDWKDREDLLSLDFQQNPDMLDVQTRRLRDSVVTSFINTIKKDFLKVERPDNKLSIIQVDVSSPDEVFSKVFNEYLVKEVSQFYIETKTKKAVENVMLLQQKVDSVRAEMTGAIHSAAQVSDATPNLNPTRQSQRVVPTQEAQLSAEANRVILSQLVQNLEIGKMTLLQEQPLIQLIDQPVYPLKVERLGKIKGVLVGSILLGVLTLLWLLGTKYYKDMMMEVDEGNESKDGV